MAYLDVITLEDAKNYLRIDDTLTEDDNRITSMIKSSLSMIERRTNILVYARSKNYLFQDYCVKVYDYPINTLIEPTDATEIEMELYSIFETDNSNNKLLTLNVGYETPGEVPSEIIECALEYVKYFYYDSENNNGKSNEIPLYIQDAINQLKRFII
jgi:hypothetical protein